MNAPAPAAGFADPVHDAQGVFRALLEAMARPGSVHPLGGLSSAPRSLGPVAGAVLLTLADFETPVWFSPRLDGVEVRAFSAFHTGAPVADSPSAATFVFCSGADDIPAYGALAIGTDEYPDRSSTLVIRTGPFGGGQTLTGPGIDGSTDFGAEGLGVQFWSLAATNAAHYPLGVDFLFAGPDALAGLPRSTRIGG